MQKQIPMMKRGICPACGSKEVYAGTQIGLKGGSYGSITIHIKLFSYARLDNFVCVSCGYVESYILDAKSLESIAESWPKVDVDTSG